MDKLTATLKSIVDETIKTLSQNKNPDSIFNSVSRTLQEIPSNRSDRFLSYLYTYYTSANPEEASPRAYMCASAFAIQSHRDFECGDHASALKRIIKANYFLGRSLESRRLSDFSVHEETITRLMEQTLRKYGAAGGKQRDNKREPARQEAARLLSQLKPESGWDSKAKAAESIAKNLLQYLEEYEKKNGINLEITLSEEYLIPLLKTWMRKQGVVARAFEDNASPKALKRKFKERLIKDEDAP